MLNIEKVHFEYQIILLPIVFAFILQFLNVLEGRILVLYIPFLFIYSWVFL